MITSPLLSPRSFLLSCPGVMLGLLLPFVSLDAADPGGSGTAIPFSEIGAKAGADYKENAIGVTQTKAGAQLRTGFQKLEAEATSEGLWLRSTSEAEGGADASVWWRHRSDVGKSCKASQQAAA